MYDPSLSYIGLCGYLELLSTQNNCLYPPKRVSKVNYTAYFGGSGSCQELQFNPESSKQSPVWNSKFSEGKRPQVRSIPGPNTNNNFKSRIHCVGTKTLAGKSGLGQVLLF